MGNYFSGAGELATDFGRLKSISKHCRSWGYSTIFLQGANEHITLWFSVGFSGYFHTMKLEWIKNALRTEKSS